MISRKAYIDKYIHHYELNGKSGAGGGLGQKMSLLADGGYREGMSLLDYGCGWGCLLEGLVDTTDYIGVDIVPQAIEIAQQTFPGKDFQVLDIGKLEVEPKDFAVAFSVFTHARKEDVPDCLADMYRNLNPKGRGLVDILEGEDKESPHFRYWERDAFEAELEKAGFDHYWLYQKLWPNGFTHTYFALRKS